VDERIEALETRLTRYVDERIEAVETRFNERIEAVETKLLAAFYGWARATDRNLRLLTQGAAGFTERFDAIEAWLLEVEQRLNLLPRTNNPVRSKRWHQPEDLVM
jgi:hypothetical protein